jgi:hypothetical protein
MSRKPRLMTEADWTGEHEPWPLLGYLRTVAKVPQKAVGRRKLRLLTVAICRTVEPFYSGDTESVDRVALVERVADKLARIGDLPAMPLWEGDGDAKEYARRTTIAALDPITENAASFCGQYAAHTHRLTTKGDPEFAQQKAQRIQAALVRCIFGNPFRPVAFDPAWRTSDVLALARGIYDERAFDRMPILADALQDAGCTNEDILSHCRDTNTPHARGCWVVDLVLSRS